MYLCKRYYSVEERNYLSIFYEGKFESIFIEPVKIILLLERIMESQTAMSIYLDNVIFSGQCYP